MPVHRHDYYSESQSKLCKVHHNTDFCHGFLLWQTCLKNTPIHLATAEARAIRTDNLLKTAYKQLSACM